MPFRSLCFAAALLVATITSLGSAQGGTVVFTDSGTIGGVELENTGIVGTTATIVISRIPNNVSFVNTVNGLSITPEPAAIDGPVTLEVTPAGGENYNLALVPPTYIKTVGATAGAQAVMSFDMTKGIAPTSLPNFLNISGSIHALLANNNPNFDYSPFAAGGRFNITFTGTTFSSGPGITIHSFADLIATVGSSVVANGSFSQAAVPEPASWALLGIGMTGFLAFRRYFPKFRA